MYGDPITSETVFFIIIKYQGGQIFLAGYSIATFKISQLKQNFLESVKQGRKDQLYFCNIACCVNNIGRKSPLMALRS